jgi:hypothetical protein
LTLTLARRKQPTWVREAPLRELAVRKRQSDVEVHCFRLFRPLAHWQCDNGTQRKIMVVDASVIFTGGVALFGRLGITTAYSFRTRS